MIGELILYNTVIIISGGITLAYLNSKKYLEKLGLSKDYIEVRKRSTNKSTLIILLSLFLTQLITILILKNKTNPIPEEEITKYLLPIVLMVILIVSLILEIKYNKINKELILKSGDNVVIDFNFELLKKIFSLKIEIPFLIITTTLSKICLDDSIWLLMFVCLIVPWYMYFSIRYAKNMNTPTFYEKYSLYLKIIGLYSYLFIFLAAVSGLTDYFLDTLKAGIFPLVALFTVLLMKAIYSSITLSKVLKQLKELKKD